MDRRSQPGGVVPPSGSASLADRVAAADLLGVAMPTEYGGKGFDAVDYLIVAAGLFPDRKFPQT